jgi:hypothetical protein
MTTWEPIPTPTSRQEATWAAERASGDYIGYAGMQTFREFLAMKAKVCPDLFRIQPFVGLAQPIPLKPTRKPGRRPVGVEKRLRGR